MSDEDKQETLTKAEEEVSLSESSIDEPKATEEVIETEEASEVEATETEQEETKKGYSNRVRELNTRAKEAEAKAKSLEEKLTELTDQARSQVQTPNFGTDVSQSSQEEPIFKPGEEIDTVEFEKRMNARDARIIQQATSRSDLMSKQNEAINRIKTESGEAVRKYPELDPDNENFNEDLSDTVTEAVEALVKSSPYTASVTKFVDKLMKPYQGAVTKEVGKQTEELAKQASQGAIKPTNVRQKDRSPEEMTIAELEAELGIVQS